MKKYLFKITTFLMFILINLSLSLSAQDTIRTESKIDKVVVFLKGAQIRRTTKCNLEKGINLVIFTKLSSQAVDKSIQVSSDSSVSIQSVNFQVNYMDSIIRKNRIKILQNNLDSLDAEKLVIGNTLEVLKNEEELLQENQVLGGEKKTMKTEDLEKACAYYHDQILEIVNLKTGAQRRMKKIDQERVLIACQLVELNTKKENPVGEVWIVAFADETGEKEFRIEYFINNAGWTPKYDIRAESVNKPAELGYKADVYQNTDDDWTNVQLILSSSNPSLGGTKPELASWLLNVDEEYGYTNNYSNTSNYNNSVTYYSNIKNDYSAPINIESDTQITGTVVDSDGTPLPGANILVKGTSIGAISDLDGKYSITVPKGSKNITISFLGFNVEELPITGTTVNCNLTESLLALDEVVVVGYGVAKKSDLTGSVVSMVNDGNGNFVSAGALSGKVAGVSSEPIRIRGLSNIRRYREPRKKMIGKTITGLNKIKENQTSVEFQLDKPYTIPSDNKKYSVDIEKYEVPVHFQYSTVPKIDPSAFLLAQMTDWAELNLLSGKVNIYFEGSFIGSSELDVQKTNDTLDISMGRDKAIVIDRKLKDEFSKKLGKNSSYTWEITVRNTKTDSINLTVEDQIPLTYSRDFEIELIDSQNATYNKNKGELSWKIDLAPLEKKVLTFRYLVKSKKR